MKTDLFQSCGHCWVFQICWHIECSTFTASSFRVCNSSARIPSPPLALFLVMLPKAQLTSHCRMSGSRWVITPSWLSRSLKSVLFFCVFSSSVYSCYLFLICDFASGSDSKESAYNVEDLGLIPGLGRSPGGGNGNPFQYSCLENPMDRGTWQAAVHGIAKSFGHDWATYWKVSTAYFIVSSASVRSILFLSSIVPTFAWNDPLVSLIFLKISLVFPICVSLCWLLRKAFLSLLAFLWNSAFKWEYLSFSPLRFTSLLFSAICKASSDNHFAFLHFFLGMVLITASYRILWTSVHSSSDILSARIPWIYLSPPLCWGIWFRLNGLVVFPTFSNFRLNFAVRGWWFDPQSVPGLVFADCIQLIHLWLQRI